MRLCFLFIVIPLWVSAQSRTGTYIGFHDRSLPGDERRFYYRFQLLQQQDTVIGLCEVYAARADMDGWDTSATEVHSVYEVFNYKMDRQDFFELLTGRPVMYRLGVPQRAPVFFAFECHLLAQATNWQAQQKIYSVVNSTQSSTGKIWLTKISDTLREADLIRSLFLPSQSKKSGKHFIQPHFNLTGIDTVEAKIEKAKPFEKRVNKEEVKLETTQSIVHIKLYDQGIIDEDTVSLYLNHIPVIKETRLSNQPIQLSIHLQQGENILSLFAHNLGRIPPNTAFMVIELDSKTYQLSLSSTLQTNAAVKLVLTTPATPPH